MDLLLVTAALRLDNLLRIAKSIKYAMQYYPGIKYTWCICKDKYNSFGSFDNALEYCKLNDINVLVYPSGKPNQKNYGGDVMNEALEAWSKEDCDPWVYILDDDNILNPLIPDCILRVNKKLPDKRIIVTSRCSADGIIDWCIKGSIGCQVRDGGNGYPLIPRTNIVDPSQGIMKLSMIRENGYIGSGFTYDYEWYLPTICDHLDETAFFNDYYGYGGERANSFHNGLRSKKEFDEELEGLSANRPGCHFFYTSDDNLHRGKVFPVSRELAKIILELIHLENFPAIK